MQDKRTQRIHIAILVFITLLIFAVNFYLVDDSSIRTPADLAFTYNKDYISVSTIVKTGEVFFVFKPSVDNAANAWVSDNKYISTNAPPPYKFRILGNHIAYYTRHLFGHDDGISYYRSHIFWCFLFLSCAIIYIYKGACLFISIRTAFFSLLAILLGPALMYIFKYPMLLTVNDPLACLIIAAGLYATLQERYIFATVMIAIGVFCRETVLVVPLFGLLYSRNKIVHKSIVAFIPVAIWLIYRYLWGYDHAIAGYDIFEGGQFNLDHSFVTSCYIFVSYGCLWGMLIIGFVNSFRDETSSELYRIARCSLIPFLVTLLFHACCARLSEMRITVLTFAPFSVFVIAAFFAKLNEFKEISRYWLIYMAGVAIAGFIAYREICMPSTAQDYQQLGDLFNIFLLGTSAYATALNLNTEMHGWAGIAIFHAVCLMLIAPVYFNAVKTKPRQLAGESDSAVPAIQP